jgi:dienelactone hydrolase
MRCSLGAIALALVLVPSAFLGVRADEPPLLAYFRGEVARIEKRPLSGITSAVEWQAKRRELQRQLREMLGIDPEPERTDLHATITGTVERPEFIVEKLHFQSRPGLYVTANLYRPKGVTGPLPAILYVCGHAEVKKDGVIYGNKAHYQHHAAWYAANGYVCLVLDTLQLGELPGLHHGTYREGMWWWQSRGYTPAGVEAWNGIRAIDYLCSRPEVDASRIGVTGRSGGGATTWWIAALDDRVAAAVPVAGITDLRDHVVEPNADGKYDMGVIEGHCDCMYFINTYRWDFDTLAALAAPKALLVENTDHDPIFPEAGVRRIHAKLQKVYDWYGEPKKLGLVIGKGGHVDSVEIRHPSFAFFEKWLKGKAVALAEILEPDRKIPVEDLKVLSPGEVPEGCLNATIHESFVPMAETPPVPKTAEEWDTLRKKWLEGLRTKVVAGWPRDDEVVPLDVQTIVDVTRLGVRMRGLDYTSQPGVRLRMWVFHPSHAATRHLPAVVMSDDKSRSMTMLVRAFLTDPDESLRNDPFFRRPAPEQSGMVLIETRGRGLTEWDSKRDAHIRRRHALLGQTVDGMRAWDLHRAVTLLKGLPELSLTSPLLISNPRDSAACLVAAALDPNIASITLVDLEPAPRDNPSFLNFDRVLGWPQAVGLLFPRLVSLDTKDGDRWGWPTELGQSLKQPVEWPRIIRRESRDDRASRHDNKAPDGLILGNRW